MKFAVRLDVTREGGFEEIPFDRFEDALREFINQVDIERMNIDCDSYEKCTDGFICELLGGEDLDCILRADFRYGDGEIKRFEDICREEDNRIKR